MLFYILLERENDLEDVETSFGFIAHFCHQISRKRRNKIRKRQNIVMFMISFSD